MASRSLRAVGATRKYSMQLPGQAPDYHDATYHYEVGSDNMTHLGSHSFMIIVHSTGHCARGYYLFIEKQSRAVCQYVVTSALPSK